MLTLPFENSKKKRRGLEVNLSTLIMQAKLLLRLFFTSRKSQPVLNRDISLPFTGQ
jgi:hypothetical protein